MTFKYQVIDSKGGIHKHTSAAERVYTHAVVTFYKKRRATAHGTEYEPKTVVSYCGNRQLAEKHQRTIQLHKNLEYIESVEIVHVMRI